MEEDQAVRARVKLNDNVEALKRAFKYYVTLFGGCCKTLCYRGGEFQQHFSQL